MILAAAPAAEAQGPYVGVSALADVVRMSGAGGNGQGAEAFGVALRLGVPLDDHWGVELEFARSAEMDVSPEARILADMPVQSMGSLGFGMNTGAVSLIFPAPEIEAERQLSTVSTLLWRRHTVSDRVDLAYLGGVAFTRAALHTRVSYPFFPMPIPVPVPRPIPESISATRLFESEAVSYGADVAVGMEGRIRMTEHVRLTPGIRMQTVDGGWSIRPAVGLQWTF